MLHSEMNKGKSKLSRYLKSFSPESPKSQWGIQSRNSSEKSSFVRKTQARRQSFIPVWKKKKQALEQLRLE